MKIQVKKGNYETFHRLLNIFARDNISHPFMKDRPDLCFKCTKLMQEELQKGNLKKEFVRKVIVQFIRNEIFSHAKAENIVLKCKDGEVALNQTVLELKYSGHRTRCDFYLEKQS